MVDLIDNKDAVIRNIDAFTTLNAKKMIKINKLKNIQHFVTHKTNNNYHFAPSEFVGCKNNPYLELKNEKVPPDLKNKIYAQLTKLLGEPFERGSPGYEEIMRHYKEYCISHDTESSASEATRRFWLIDSDNPGSRRPANNARGSAGSAETLPQDLEYINSDKTIDATTRPLLIDARIGQGKFRDDVMMRWGGACAFSGCTTPEALRASHIKPWRDCSNDERLDPANGLILTPNLDALFDRYLISFDDNGQILVSSRLSKEEQKILGVRDGSLLRKPDKKQCSYLAHHRNKMSDKHG